MNSIKKYSVLLLVVLIVTVNLTGCRVAHSFYNNLPNNANGNLIPIDVADDYQTLFFPDKKQYAISSLTAFSKKILLAADYENVIQIDTKNPDELSILQKPDGIDIWNPTGLYYDQKAKKLYVANYNGHNILKCRVENEKLVVELDIKHSEMISPENVAVSDDGSKIAVADYDGSAIFLFDNQGNLIWKNNLNLAHGVAIDEDAVYATGLMDRCVTKYTWDGKQSVLRGSLKMEGKDAYVWPTSLFIYEEYVILTDAHSGRVIILDKELEYVNSFGANGLGVQLLNFPYCTIVNDGDYFISDTFNNRILRLDASGKLVEQIISSSSKFNDDINEFIIYPYHDEPYVYGTLEGIPASLFNPLMDNTQYEVLSAYSLIDLHSLDSQKSNYTISLCDYTAYTDFPYPVPYLEQLYITWVHHMQYKGKSYYLIGSPQRSPFMYIFNETDKIFSISDVPSLPIWRTEEKLESLFFDPEQEIVHRLDALEPYTNAFIDLLEKGVPRYEAYIQSFTSYFSI